MGRPCMLAAPGRAPCVSAGRPVFEGRASFCYFLLAPGSLERGHVSTQLLSLLREPMAKIRLLRAAGGCPAERGSFPAERGCLFPLRWTIHRARGYSNRN